LEKHPTIDRIAREGNVHDVLRHAELYPLKDGMIPPQLPGSPSYQTPGTPALAKFLHDLGYTTGQFRKNHLGSSRMERQ